MSLIERFTRTGPKRVLSLDGGGIRGAVTVGYLQKMEALLRARHDDPSLRLCDYFDLIAGTSTGAIIASLLAIGKETSEISSLYMELGGEIFSKERSWWTPRDKLRASYDSTPLEEHLARIFGDRTLGSGPPDVQTGLCIVTKRADTQSTWPLINHPAGKYFEYNRDISLANAVRASAAAPTYFEPEEIDVGGGQLGAFVDGGVSMFNNPALQALMVAWLEGFPFKWAKGADDLLLVSVGTGRWRHGRAREEVLGSGLVDWGKNVPGMLMEDASWHNQLVLQWLSDSPTAVSINGEVGDLGADRLGPAPLLSYLRYDVELTSEGLSALGLDTSEERATELREMSEAENRHELAAIGLAAASSQMEDAHFPQAFDLVPE